MDRIDKDQIRADCCRVVHCNSFKKISSTQICCTYITVTLLPSMIVIHVIYYGWNSTKFTFHSYDMHTIIAIGTKSLTSCLQPPVWFSLRFNSDGVGIAHCSSRRLWLSFMVMFQKPSHTILQFIIQIDTHIDIPRC